jgi:exodeoxyribonuclease VII small subunit
MPPLMRRQPCVDPRRHGCVTLRAFAPQRTRLHLTEPDQVSRNSKAPDFEQALAELETLVGRLEGGDLPLDEALKLFERGVALTRQCQSSLQSAQQKVEILLKRSGEAQPEPFEEPGAQSEQGDPE